MRSALVPYFAGIELHKPKGAGRREVLKKHAGVNP